MWAPTTITRIGRAFPFSLFDSPFSFDARCGLFLFLRRTDEISPFFPFPPFTLSFLFLVSISPCFLHSLGPMLPIYSKLPKPFLLFSTILISLISLPTSPTSPHFFSSPFPILSCFKPSAASPHRLTPVTSCSKSVLNAPVPSARSFTILSRLTVSRFYTVLYDLTSESPSRVSLPPLQCRISLTSLPISFYIIMIFFSSLTTHCRNTNKPLPHTATPSHVYASQLTD